jgi:transposase-like protein
MSKRPTNRQGLSREYKAKMIAKRLAQGETLAELAKAYEITEVTAGRYLRRFQKETNDTF